MNLSQRHQHFPTPNPRPEAGARPFSQFFGPERAKKLRNTFSRPLFRGRAGVGDLLKQPHLQILIVLVTLSVLLWGCAPADRCKNAEPVVRILFIGNSYTYVNDLPGMFTRLSCSGGKRVETGMAAPGGWTLAQHLASADTLNAIRGQRWDVIVLQEQSQLPASASYRDQGMYPAVRGLVSLIRSVKARPYLFLTWGHRDGWPDNQLNSYAAMQDQLYFGYVTIAKELSVDVAPVGSAWKQAVSHTPPLDLWQEDGSHPTQSGTYLAACVFYASLFQKSPVGLEEHAGLPADTARTIQTIAAQTVLGK